MFSMASFDLDTIKLITPIIGRDSKDTTYKYALLRGVQGIIRRGCGIADIVVAGAMSAPTRNRIIATD